MKERIDINSFESNSTRLKNNQTCTVLLVVDTCKTCKKYMENLDKINFSYYILSCNQQNMPVISLIASKLNMQNNLSVPIVLKYINGDLIAQLERMKF